MAANDDLDDFFKKKDRKGHKNKKSSGFLTNNQELLKQLEIVTTATSAFKGNYHLDEDEEELTLPQDSVFAANFAEEIDKNPIKLNKTKNPDSTKHVNEHETKTSDENQQDEWEDFQSPHYQYDRLRLKFSVENDFNDEYFDDENNPNNNQNHNDMTGDGQLQKDKCAWNMNQIKEEKETNTPDIQSKSVEQPIIAEEPATVSVAPYLPPARRTGGSSITIVSNNVQRPSKKKEPNLASTEEFPSLGAAANRK